MKEAESGQRGYLLSGDAAFLDEYERAHKAIPGQVAALERVYASKPDERQASIGMRAAALSGITLVVVALGGVVIATAMGTFVWPFLLFSVVGGASNLVGLIIYRDQ